MNRKNLSEEQLAQVVERFKARYRYDAETGHVINNETGRVVKGGAKVAVNSKSYSSYLCVSYRVNGRLKHAYLHHLVWLLCKGRYPTLCLDHINGIKTDNRIENLREVTDAENKLNKLHPWKPNKDTGVPGVWSDHKGYCTKMRGKEFYFPDRCEAFFHATMCGKRYYVKS